ncbi:MAG: molybdopterin-dependent oxidoreductase, partial [Thaumarchaeota archaeon]|nr:molybdopterin-dependent oxidoreductase [Nitrososphaerota archaeon]
AVQGGIVQGVGGVLMEDLPYDSNGQLQASTFMDYMIPTATDVPKITLGRTISPTPFIPGGFKGAGEGGVVHPPETLCSAVEDALKDFGVRVLETPLTPDYIRRLLNDAKNNTKSDS